MNRISKEDIFNLIVSKVKPNDNELQFVSKIVEDIYDITKEEIAPLDKEETFMFRKRYGVLDNGIPQTVEFISKEYNIGYTKLRKLLETTFVKFIFRIKKMQNQISIKKMSSIDMNENKEELENLSIASTKLSSSCKNKLMRSFIFTIKDLMVNSTIELKRILNSKEMEELTSYIHSLNIAFLDELSFDSKKEIFANSYGETIYNSSIYWLDNVKNIPTLRLNKLQINNIRTLFLSSNFLSAYEQKNILQEFKDLISKTKKISN